MVPLILSEYPQMPAKEALRLSNEMTRGHKMKMFILDLSFFNNCVSITERMPPISIAIIITKLTFFAFIIEIALLFQHSK